SSSPCGPPRRRPPTRAASPPTPWSGSRPCSDRLPAVSTTAWRWRSCRTRWRGSTVHELFGIPMNALLIILLVGLGAALGLTAALAVRNPILVKLGTRNVGRRRGRSALIVVGLMLGTTIIAAALTTGDTMSHTIRQTAVRSLGETDEVVSAKGLTADIPGELGQATGIHYFDQTVVDRIDRATSSSDLVDGVTGAIVTQVAMQAPGPGQ